VARYGRAEDRREIAGTQELKEARSRVRYQHGPAQLHRRVGVHLDGGVYGRLVGLVPRADHPERVHQRGLRLELTSPQSPSSRIGALRRRGLPRASPD
jgi:hypothetical protein